MGDKAKGEIRAKGGKAEIEAQLSLLPSSSSRLAFNRHQTTFYADLHLRSRISAYHQLHPLPIATPDPLTRASSIHRSSPSTPPPSRPRAPPFLLLLPPIHLPLHVRRSLPQPSIGSSDSHPLRLLRLLPTAAWPHQTSHRRSTLGGMQNVDGGTFCDKSGCRKVSRHLPLNSSGRGMYTSLS